MNASSSHPIHVVGGGLVGTLAAIMLARHGLPVELYERRTDMRKGKAEAGRSINLVVTARGLNALAKVGLRERILDIGLPMKGRMLHDISGTLSFVPYGQKDDEVIYAISRGLLNQRLLEAAGEEQNITLHFQHRCTHYDIATRRLTFVDESSGTSRDITAPVAIGTDGAWSALRKAMFSHVPNFNYSQDFLSYGYKELVIPPNPDGSFAMDATALHIWPRKHFMVIALPNIDGSFTCTLFLPFEGAESFATLQTPADVSAFFAQHFADAVPLMPTLLDDFFANPTGSMATIQCAPWHVGGQALLMGDASHAIVPFFGQGMNSGFEDCSELFSLLQGFDGNWQALFATLEQRRKPNTDAIATLALENFIEMRDTTDDPRFKLKKEIGFELERRYPGRFIPRYSMVVFHPEIPYAEALRLGRIQDAMLHTLTEGISTLAQVDWTKADRLMGEFSAQHKAA